MKPVGHRLILIIFSYCFSAVTGLNAEPIFPGDALVVPASETGIFNDETAFTVPLFTISPVPPDAAGSAPELRDPLGLGVDTGLGFFDRDVLFLDLLATPDLPVPPGELDIELPPGTLRDVDMLDDLNAFYFSYDGRAFDNSLLDLENMEIIDVNGVPRSREGAPLSIGDFGRILPRP